MGGALYSLGRQVLENPASSAQQDVQWSLGKEAFGIKPTRPLRILTIQAENDDGDIGEMAQGVAHGMQLTPDEKASK